MRPTDYNEEIEETICERLSIGESMRQICSDEAMPNRSTVLRWMAKYDSFAAKCAHARDLQADLMDDKILDVAEDALAGRVDVQAAKVAISAYQWRASKLKPKKYGDKIATEHSGNLTIDGIYAAVAGKTPDLPSQE